MIANQLSEKLCFSRTLLIIAIKESNYLLVWLLSITL